MNYSGSVSRALKNKTTELFLKSLLLLCLLGLGFLMGYNTGLLAVLLATGWYFLFVDKDPERPLWVSIIFILPIRIPVAVFGEEYHLKLLFFGLVLISLFSYGLRVLKERERPQLPLKLPVFLLLLLFIAGAFRSEAPLLDKVYGLRSFIFRSIFFYLLLNLYTKKGLVKIVKALLLSSIVLALLGIYQHLFKTYFIANCNLPDFRAMGTFDHPNVYALFVFLTGVLSAAMFFYTKIIKEKYYFAAVFLLNLAALFMAVSRSLWLCLLLALVLFFFMYKKKALLILAGAAAVLVLLLPGNLKEKFMHPVNMNDPSHQIRAGLIVNGMNMIKSSPVFGLGDGNSHYQYDKYKIRDTEGITRIHTQLITLTAEYGFLGLALFIFFVGAVLSDMLQRLKLLKNKEKILQYALIGIFAGLLLNAQFNGNFFQESYVWLVMGLCLLPVKGGVA